ncbi:MAG: hypothetical protein RLZZ502_1071 [Pseudomonadota bacterium]|jgi:GTP cyclohydrolase I
MMNAPDKFTLPDTQSLPDTRQLAIQRVGIRGLRYPLAIKTANGAAQHTTAHFAMYVGLPPEVKGTHMSRFLEVLEAHQHPLAAADFLTMEAFMRERLEANSAHLEANFTYFLHKTAPVSGVPSLLDIDVTWKVVTEHGQTRQILIVKAPVTSLCPCSKKISDYGAHNQRSEITLSAEIKGDISIEELARVAEEEASCEVFGLLKRPDEKWVTERAYDNPKFVEDLVRDMALRLSRDPRIGAYTVASENFESIHNHSAYAEIVGHGLAA